MTTPLRPCGRPECRLCNPRPIHEEPKGDTLATLLLSAAMIVLACIFAFVLLPALVL
jgi:hypothetical protein